MEQTTSTGPSDKPSVRLGRDSPLGKVTLPQVPDHQLLRRIGRGSYGEVWLARTRMGAYRAVKIVFRRAFSDARPFERELSGIRKFEPISRSHEGFIDILHVGLDDTLGCFYYVMELGDDQQTGQAIEVERYAPKTLAREIAARGRLSCQACLELGLALSYSLSELHKHNLVHRDVKPSNIIFVNGIPKLADIGLVADIDGANSFVGTEGFIPPEGPGTARADVYSLGKVLYEALTGRDRQDYPELPTLRVNDAERHQFLELNEIIVRACSSEITRRYPSAWEMNAELILLQNGKSVKRLHILERRLLRAKRIGAVGGLVTVLLGTLGYQVYRGYRLAVESRERQIGAATAYGNRTMESGDLLGALPWYSETLHLQAGDARAVLGDRLRIGCLLAQCPRLVQMCFEPGEVDWVSISPRGGQALVVQLSGHSDLFDIRSGRLRFHIDQRFGGTKGAFSHDGAFVATASEGKTLCVWSTRDGAKVLELPHPAKVFSVCFSPDDSHILTGCGDGVARLWRFPSGKFEREFKGNADAILFATFSRDGSMIATAGRDGTARLYDEASGAPIGSPMHHADWVCCADFSPDGRQLVTGCMDHYAYVWDIQTRKLIFPALQHHDGVSSVEFSPDGRTLLTASLDNTVRLWASRDHQLLNPNGILRQSDRVTSARFGPGGHRIIVGCVDGTVRIWDLAAEVPETRVLTNGFSANAAAYLGYTHGGIRVYDTASNQERSPLIKPSAGLKEALLNQDGQFVITLSTNRQHQINMEVWKSSTGRRVGMPIALTNSPQLVRFNVTGSRLLLATGSIAQTWDAVHGTALVSKIEHPGAVKGAAFSPNGTLVATWAEGSVQVWNTTTGKAQFTPLEHPFPVTRAEFSPNGAFLVTCGADNGFNKCFAQVWDAKTGQPAGPRLYHSDGIVWASFSPDGRRLTTAGENFLAFVWDPFTGRQITPELRHEHALWTSEFDSTGRYVVTTSSDRTARVWDAETGDPLTPALRHHWPLRNARFLNDGRHLVTFDRNGRAIIWDLPVEQMPVADLLDMCRLFCASPEKLSSAQRLALPDTLKALWQRLRAKYPSRFSTSLAEIQAWDEFQAEESEVENNPAAAEFHIHQLLKLQAHDRALAQRH